MSLKYVIMSLSERGISIIMKILLENRNLAQIYPVEFGYEKCLPKHFFGPYIRRYYLIHYIVDGTGTFENPKATYNLEKGQAFLIRPGEVCTYYADVETPWEYIWIGLSGKLAEKFDLCSDVFEPDASIFLEMLNAEKYVNLAQEYLTGVCFKLYCDIFNGNKKINYADRVINYINTNYMHNIKISDISNLLSLDRKYLARIFKSKTNMTIQEYLTHTRLTEAKRLLEEGYNVAESAHMTGYNDYIVFSKAYKKYYGFSPIESKNKSKKG